MTVKIKNIIQEDIKSSLKAGDKNKLDALRLMLAAIKQREIKERETAGPDASLDDAQIIVELDKMLKQRRESIVQYKSGAREDLALKEQQEIDIIKEYLPKQLSATEITKLINEAIMATAASSIKDMGKVMAYLKPKIQGRTDIAKVSIEVKAKLAG